MLFLFADNSVYLSSFTDDVYKNMSHLAQLRFLDLCGAQVDYFLQNYDKTIVETFLL